ncbi:uncharacterized protein LOC129398296 [Pan paniscus]|uniref:uncharacterized protein LOC129398296 n=1 Tax=Pan paniscus TaxID=9597 RepID=UPI0024366923|nr:uncharacterized protein LOC129398296 [Pan paniscus]
MQWDLELGAQENAKEIRFWESCSLSMGATPADALPNTKCCDPEVLGIERGSDVTVGTALWRQGRPLSSASAHSDTDLVKPPSWPDPAMGTRLLCWVVLGFLETDHTGAGVSQSPKYKVTKRGQDVALRCDPISGHVSLFWYQQALGQGPEFLTYFRNEAQLDKSGLPSDRFFAERPEGSVSTLKIQRTQQEDSAVYLCASSLATAWHSRLLPVHKPHPSLSLQLLETLNRGLSLLLTFHGKITSGLQPFFG